MKYFTCCFALGIISSVLISSISTAQVLVTGTLSGNNYNVKLGGNYGGTNYAGHSFTFIALSSNTGISTLSINGGSTATLVKNISQNLSAGDIKANQAVPVIFDGTYFQILNQSNTASSQWISTTTGGNPSIYYLGTYLGLNMPPVLGAAIVGKSSKDFDDVLRLYRPDASFQVFRVRDNVNGGIVTAFDGSNNSRAQISADIGIPSYVMQLGIGTTNPLATLDVIGNARITGPLTVSSFAGGPSIANLGINSVGGITTIAGFVSQWISTGTGLIYYSNALTDKVIIGVPYRINPFWKTSIVADDSPFLLSVENNNAITNTGAAATLTRTNGPWGARTPLSINDEIGSLNFAGSAAAALNISAASIRSVADAAWSSTSGPSRLDFFTTNVNTTVTSLAMTIKSNGNVGIGTPSPQTKFEVNGNARFLGPVTISGFAGGTSVYTLGLNSLGGIVTTSGGNITGARGGNSTGIAYWSGANTLTSNPAFYWNNGTSTLGIGGTLIKATGAAADNNFFVGQLAGTINSTGFYNNFIGLNTGSANTIGNANNFLGGAAGQNNVDGSYNNFLGFYAGASNLSGTDNIFMGQYAGFSNTNGSYNMALGYYSDLALATLTNAIAIGYKATVGGSNMMVLGGTGGNAVKVGIGTGLPATSLDVNGNARFLGPVSISGFATGTSLYTLGVNSLGGIVTVSGGTVATGFSGFTSTDVTLGVSTTQISFDGENYDKASALSGTTYIVPSAGEYLFTVSATTNNIGQVDLLLLKNGIIVKEVRISPTPNSGVYNTAQLTAFIDLNLSDSITVIIRQYTGIPQTLFSLSGIGTTFSGKKIF